MLAAMSLLRRVFIANSALLVLGTLVLAFAPIEISARIAWRQALVLAVWLLLLVAANLILLRPLFAPLERLAARMENVDVLQAGQEIPVGGPSEVQALERAFNLMLRRLGDERREAGRRALVAQEDERRRIALGLHDEVGQTMTGVLFQLKRLADFHKRHERESGPMLKRLQQAVIDDANVFAVLMDAVRCCSLGQITHALFEVGGQYRRNM